MTASPVGLLIVDQDRDLVRRVAAHAAVRGYRVMSSTSLSDAAPISHPAAVDVAIVDLGVDAESGADAIRQARSQAPDAEIVVTIPAASPIPAIRSYEMSAFASLTKPLDLGQLFATIERAAERRRMNLDNRRLVWELQTINEIADEIAGSLELGDVLEAALQKVVGALAAVCGSIRLKDDLTGRYDVLATAGPAVMEQLSAGHPGLPWPSERVIATRSAFFVEDFHALLPPDVAGSLPVRSALSVPIAGGDVLLGTLTVAAAAPGHFLYADERLVAIIARQMAAGIQNARLHSVVRRAKRDWEQTFDAISDPIAVFDARGRMLRGNRALASHLERRITTLRGVRCHEVGFCGDACAEAHVHQEHFVHTEVTRPDGQIFSVATFPVLEGADGASFVQVAKNVTEEIRSARRLRQMSDELAVANGQAVAALERVKSTQAQLLQAEKLSAIGQLVAGVAHELNNPLTSVIGYAQLLQEELLETDASAQRSRADLALDLRRIAEESERAARIVRNLLAFARRQSAARTAHDVVDLVNRVLSLRSYEFRLNGVELECEFESGLPSVIADASQLQQALLNLVLNAEQAMRGRARRRMRVGARFDEPAAAVELFVGDTGHGIDQNNLSRVFDPFFTTREVGEGTGLGLSICYGIVRDHGGQISVESRLNVGTTFSMLLPAHVEEREAGEPILIAHGDQGERDYLTAALSGWGHEAVSVATSADALSALRGRRVQALVLDRGLLAPDLEAWRDAYASKAAAVPLVLVSMAAEEQDVERFGQEEAAAVLAPPFQLRALRSAIRTVCKECV
jgi:two-component system NtrC family sensor kinase